MKVAVAGAGAVGCFCGGLLARAGHEVTLLARPRVIAEIAEHGLHLTDYAGLDATLPAERLTLTEDPAALAGAELVLVTVKSPATPAIAAEIARHAPAHAVVISLQNGMGNPDVLRAALPGRDVRAGMVPFNVVPMGQGRFHRASSGEILIAPGAGGLAAALSSATLPLRESAEIDAIRWGKLLLNLNNAVNALSGLPLRAQLMDRRWRRIMARQMTEALSVLKGADIRVRSTTPVPAALVPWILALPTPLFSRVAASMLTIDPEARTSMAQDLAGGRPTEIDALQGEVLRLAESQGIDTPLMRRITTLIRAAEAAGKGTPDLPPEALRP
ncbi:2-dehydropantoate 2-reductase [Aquicoccus sp. SCR17]|nr:2-dehydropantoate 2-reductase [Carideicomes alvinocaridis]